MNKYGKILLYVVGGFAVYSLIVSLFHMPIFGGSLFFLLFLACPLMFLFMDHGEHSKAQHTDVDDKQTGNTHQH